MKVHPRLLIHKNHFSPIIVELGVVIGKRGRDITQSQAEDYISGYALAIDMTARNVQDEVKKLGLPWSTAKGFDTFTPIGTFIPKSEIQDPHDLLLTLTINGTIKQHGSTSDMISRIPRLIEHISSIMTLEENDLILTGTPSGVGPISPEDTIECSLASPTGKLSSIVFKAVARQGGYEFKGK
ncbi:hypothetical protein E1B28_009311 [Marasmius oreades]|uniref:Fumarylacetoacetase-like C-terminal domain-containing protein n=1 Tax=Marasmius oreades TaxID=181124 RepID=A0A9P7S091_9AGAR|nr:uncharacterized protein E1B28_009311 [Marasmius oreades]KAG7093014.1 hypothetical protein E1B28_009311 [Marasmius oreades]